MQDSSHRHEQEGLIEAVGKYMGNRTVNGQLRSYANAAHHIPHLVDEAVAQDSP